MLGQFTILAASGPGANLYWGGDVSGWVTAQSDAQLFPSVVNAQHTHIIGLPANYHTYIFHVFVEVVRPPDEVAPGYDPCDPCI